MQGRRLGAGRPVRRASEYSKQKMMVWIRVAAADVKRSIQVSDTQSRKEGARGEKKLPS